jgi:hypothetical protein
MTFLLIFLLVGLLVGVVMNRFTNRMLLYCISILQLFHFSLLSFPSELFYSLSRRKGMFITVDAYLWIGNPLIATGIASFIPHEVCSRCATACTLSLTTISETCVLADIVLNDRGCQLQTSRCRDSQVAGSFKF